MEILYLFFIIACIIKFLRPVTVNGAEMDEDLGLIKNYWQDDLEIWHEILLSPCHGFEQQNKIK